MHQLIWLLHIRWMWHQLPRVSVWYSWLLHMYQLSSYIWTEHTYTETETLACNWLWLFTVCDKLSCISDLYPIGKSILQTEFTVKWWCTCTLQIFALFELTVSLTSLRCQRCFMDTDIGFSADPHTTTSRVVTDTFKPDKFKYQYTICGLPGEFVKLVAEWTTSLQLLRPLPRLYVSVRVSSSQEQQLNRACARHA